jgi:hypothetical protein
MFRYHVRKKGSTEPSFKGWPFPISVILLVAVPLLWGLLAGGPVTAQGSIDWSFPVNLSNSPESSGRPAIVADGYGYVHVFWTEDVGGPSILDIPGQLIGDGNTIFYTRWDGMSWTQPIDILFVPGDEIADYIAATVDAENRLHVVWTGQSNFYYATAPSWQADSGHAWSKPVVVATDSARSQWESDIVVDSSGDLHIVYATGGDQPGIYHTRSSDGGTTWQLATKLSEPFAELEVAYSTVMIVADGADRLHVVWQTHEQEGFGQGVYYARSTDRGVTWTPPVRMAWRDPGEYGVEFPYIVSRGESELHMIYIDGAWHTGRWHRISQDGGATWSDAQQILTNLEGVNGYTVPLVDGDGGLHLVTTMRTITQVAGPFFYARWLGTGWSPPELPFRGSDRTGPGAHWTAATVRLGNEIHVVWNTNFSHKAGEIWHSRGKISSVTTAQALAIPTAEMTAPATTATPAAHAPTAVPERQPLDLAETSPPPVPEATPLLVGVLPVLLLVGAVVVWTRGRSR